MKKRAQSVTDDVAKQDVLTSCDPLAAVTASPGTEAAIDVLNRDTFIDITEQEVGELQKIADNVFGRKVPVWVKVLLVVFLGVLIIWSFFVGRYGLTPLEVINGIVLHVQVAFDPSMTLTLEEKRVDAILFKTRLPRILLVALVGAALAVAGAAYQGMFKNPLVSPDILGSSAGASFGACLALLYDAPNWVVQVGAFSGAMLAVGLAVWLNRLVKYDAILGLVLGGILVSTLFQSGTSIIKYVADATDKLPEITFWLMGSFTRVQESDLMIAIIPMAFGFIVLMLQSWKLNVLSFGDDEARALGVNTKVVRLIVIFASTLLTSVSVAIAGIIGWIGLVIPHLARAIVGPNYKVLLPTSMFIGAGYLLIIDNISRLISAFEMPIGILTSLLGVPFFVFIYYRNMKGWN